jgi:hypothetical protein
MRYRSLALISVAFLMTACGGIQRVPFPESELAALDLQGDTVITGKVFLIDQFEEEQIAEETTVVLEPVSSYSSQWYEVAYLKDRALAKADPRYEKYLKKASTDKVGQFSLSGIAPGEYLLNSSVFWKAITCSGNVAKTEVLVSKRVSIKGDEKELEISLTREFESPVEICNLYNQSDWNKDDWEW